MVVLNIINKISVIGQLKRKQLVLLWEFGECHEKQNVCSVSWKMSKSSTGKEWNDHFYLKQEQGWL